MKCDAMQSDCGRSLHSNDVIYKGGTFQVTWFKEAEIDQ